MKCITNRASEKHITPLQDAMWHRGILGIDTCVFNCFDAFEATIVSNNEIRIASGIGAIQGRFFCVEPGTFDVINIANGAQGEKRIDLICAEYSVDTANDTQDCKWVVLQGESTTGNPTAPATTKEDIDNGGLIRQETFYEVHIEGITITEVVSKYQLWTLPLINGGVGADLSEVPTGALISKSSKDKLSYWNKVPIEHGGTGADLSEVPIGAIITMGSSGKLGYWNAVPIDHGGHGATTAEGARKNLGLGAVAVEDILTIAKGGTGADLSEIPVGAIITMGSNSKLTHWNAVPIDHGGHGATTAEGARKNLGLGAVAVEDILTIAKGGTGADLSEVPNGAIITMGSNGKLTYWNAVPIDHGGHGATTAEGARKNLGLGAVAIEDVAPIIKGGTGGTTAAAAKKNLGMGKLLWDGTWTSGTCTIPNTDDYSIFIIDFVDHATPMLAVRNGDYIRGLGGYSTGNTVETYQFAATRSGNVWTLVEADRISHNPSGTHSAIATLSVQYIWGAV